MAGKPRIAVLIALTSIAGCTLFTTLDDYAGSWPAADSAADALPDLDGASEEHEAAAPGESGTPDADAAVDAPILPPPECGDASFCDDFERTAVKGEWDLAAAIGGASIDLSSHAHTGTKGLRVTLAAQAGSAAGMYKAFPSPSKFSLAYFVFIPSGAEREFDINQTRFAYADRTEIVGVIVSDKFTFGEQEYTPAGVGVAQNNLLERPLILDRWVKLEFEVDLVATPNATLTLRIDGEVALDKAPLSRKYGKPTTAESVAGALHSTFGPKLELDMDEIRINLK